MSVPTTLEDTSSSIVFDKVLIAQERMATNHGHVFAKAQPSPINFLAEVRGAVEKGGKTIRQFPPKPGAIRKFMSFFSDHSNDS
ncbi:DNA-dependent RNA polymerase II [Marasmius sp. AFHP31]|nr:DNA-dependent RNA polymerase II [Marasmius sp. AFHP31]